jgi:hypothetical protein
MRVMKMIELVDGYSWAWAIWGAGFLVIEGLALKRKAKGDTLSEHVWQLFSVKHKGAATWFRRGGLYLFLAWLVTHFVTGGAI